MRERRSAATSLQCRIWQTILILVAAGCHVVPDPVPAAFVPGTATIADSTRMPEAPGSAAVDPEAVSEEQAASSFFQVPRVLPGARVAPLSVPVPDPGQTPEERMDVVTEFFPPPQTPPERSDLELPQISLSQLQGLAVEYSPILHQAAADVERARGLTVQAGLSPNPTIGYQGDTIGTADSAGYNGISMSQEIVTAGKLGLAESAQRQRVIAAEANFRKARIQLATSIRRGYFKVLVAQQELEYSRALLQLNRESYQAQVNRVASGESAPYEPLQLRVNVVAAGNKVIRAGNQLEAAWRQLAAATGRPSLPRHKLSGFVGVPAPEISYEDAVAMVQEHSDLQAATAGISAAQKKLLLQEAEATPNLLFGAVLQHDDTTPDAGLSTNLMLSTEFPVFNRNQGNIQAAHAELVRAKQDYTAIQNRLMSEVAERFGRYQTGRAVSASYRTEIVPDQVRAYRGIYNNFLIDGQLVDFTGVVNAQQTLGDVIESYTRSLDEEWTAAVDLAEILQVSDLLTMDGAAKPEAP